MKAAVRSPLASIGPRLGPGGDPLWLLSDARLFAAVLAAAFNLRIGIVAVGPLVEDIRADTGMSSGLSGALTMIPFTCMGLFAFLGPPLLRRWGISRVVIAALAMVAVGSVGRAAGTDPWLLLGWTIPIGLGIALIGVSLPAVVKERFPQRAGAVTGAYVAVHSLGIALVGFVLVPLTHLLGGWRPAFLLLGLPAVLAIGFWVGGVRRGESSPGEYAPAASVAPPPGKPATWRQRARPSRTAALLGLVFGLQSMCFAGMISWAPTIYEEAGWSQEAAALTTSSIGIGTIVCALIFPVLTDGRDRRPWIAAVAVLMGSAVLGIGFAATEPAWLWLTMFAIGTGAIFPLLMALPLDMTGDPISTADLAAWMLGIGAVISSLAPVMIGALRDASGGFGLPLVLLGCCGMAAALPIMLAPRPRFLGT